MRGPIEARFWPKVDKRSDSECWPWIASRNRYGYGTFGVGSSSGGVMSVAKAHRVSWELHNGQIPDGLYVCHGCDNPPCVNPAHLFLGTAHDNFDDMRSKARGSRGSGHSAAVKRGRRHSPPGGKSKLTEQHVQVIRFLRSSTSLRLRHIAELFGVSISNICFIASGKTWCKTPSLADVQLVK